jgi:hypothetical protein
MYSFGVTLPRAGLFSDLITDAFIIAIIGFVINISQAKLLAKKNSYAVHPDQVRIHPILDYSYCKTLEESDTSYWCQLYFLYPSFDCYTRVYVCVCVVYTYSMYTGA